MRRRINYLLGGLGVWLCNHCYPRPVTQCERNSCIQYCDLMIDSLRGKIPWYGRDAAQAKGEADK